MVHRDNIGLGLQQAPGPSIDAKLHAKSFETISTQAGKLQNAPYQSAPIQYGAKKQYTTKESKAPLLDDKAKRFIQQVCGKCLFLGRAVDSTLLCSISTIALQSSKPTDDTMQQTLQLLDYLASAVSLLPNLETVRQERSVLLLVEQKLLVKEGKSGCA
jgi:hypothetical protein